MNNLPSGFVPIDEIPTHGINNIGQIFSTISNKVLKTRKDKDGYNRLNLVINKKHTTVKPYHYVARYFVPGFEEGLIPNHKDGDKSNDSFDNLEWVDQKTNSNHAVYVLGCFDESKVKPKAIVLEKDGIEFSYPSIRVACFDLGICRVMLKRNMKLGVPYKGYTAHLI